MTYNWKYHQAEKKQRLDNGFPNVPQSVFAKLGVTTDVLHAIDKELLGYIILPGMDEYAKFSKGSGMSPFDQGDPLIIFRCEDMQDVWIALRASHDYDWPFVARSGGHSTAGSGVMPLMTAADVSAFTVIVTEAVEDKGPWSQYRPVSVTVR